MPGRRLRRRADRLPGARAAPRRCPDADHLDLAFAGEGGGWSRGTLVTAIESLPSAGASGATAGIVPVPLAADVDARSTSPVGRRTVVSIAWGDVATAFHTTGIPNIRDLHRGARAQVALLQKLRLLLPLAGLEPVKRLLQFWVRRTVTGPSADAPRAREPDLGAARETSAVGRDAHCRPPRATP